MTFEKQFPSLHEAETTGEGTTKSKGNFVNQYSKEDVENYCLDRQRVKDSIFLCTIGNSNNLDRLRLLDELGLEMTEAEKTTEEKPDMTDWDNPPKLELMYKDLDKKRIASVLEY